MRATSERLRIRLHAPKRGPVGRREMKDTGNEVDSGRVGHVSNQTSYKGLVTIKGHV